MTGRPRNDADLPADERLIMPETRYEVIDGEVVYVSPSDEPHGSRHSKLSALLEAVVADAYDVASDMLTRTSEKNDFAPDASVYPAARDPETGRRQLEELAFEVVSTETLAHASRKAAKLLERGVRRVFAIDVERRRGLEHSVETGTWEILGPDAVIEDACFAAPLPVSDLVGAAKVDDAMARALLAKGNPVIEGALSHREAQGRAEGQAEGRAEGKAEGKASAVLAVLDARDVPVDAEARARIAATRDEAVLDRWLARAGLVEDAAEL